MTGSGKSRWLAHLYLAFLALALGCAVFNNYNVIGWNISLLVLACVALLYWLPAVPGGWAPLRPAWVRWAMLLFPCYVALQLVPLPVATLRFLSPERARLLDGLRPLMGVSSWAPLSAVPSATAAFFLRIAGYTLAFLVIRDIAWRLKRESNWMPAVCLVAVATIEAVVGLYGNSAAPPSANSAQGSYADRNHFAGLLAMALPLAVAYACAQLGDKRRGTGPPWVWPLLKGLAGLWAGAILFSGIVESLSKMGFVAGLGGLFVMGALALISRLGGWKRGAALTCLAALFVFGFIFLPSERIVEPMAETMAQPSTADLEGRRQIWGDTLHLFAEYPVFGSGLGTYPTVFPKFQTSSVDFFVPHAHNDYLEYATDLGVVGFLILAAILGTTAWTALRAAIRGPDRDTHFLGLGCAGALAAILIHSTVEFNLHNRANALALAWIAGIAMCLVDESAEPASEHAARWFPKRFALALALVLLVYTPAWLVFEIRYVNNPSVEARFCRFGICDTETILEAQTPAGESQASAPVGALMEAVHREPSSNLRWYYLCEALRKAGDLDQARYCFANDLALGPEAASEMALAADFYWQIGQNQKALELASHALRKTSSFDDTVFNWFSQREIPAGVALGALPAGPRASRSYLRYLMRAGDAADSAVAWSWALAHGYADDRLAYDYTGFLFGARQYEAAAKAWTAYLGDRSNGYPASNRVFNGDFESELSPSPFDWKIDHPAGVQASIDPGMAHTGARSLRIHFNGVENIFYHHVSQAVAVTPGTYQFEAYVRTQDLTTTKGIQFSISDSENSSRLNVQTEQLTGTHDWNRIGLTIRVPSETRLLNIQVMRQPVVLRFDDRIKGTVWIDSVSLRKLP